MIDAKAGRRSASTVGLDSPSPAAVKLAGRWCGRPAVPDEPARVPGVSVEVQADLRWRQSTRVG